MNDFVENKIIQLDDAIKKDPGWSVISRNLNLQQLQFAFTEVTHLTHNFIYTQDYENTSIIKNMWFRLMTLENDILRMYDRSGYTSLIGSYWFDYIDSFQFAQADEFKKFEMQTLSQINIPQEIWDKIWLAVDENKFIISEKIRNRKDPFSSSHFFNIRDAIEMGPGVLKPMSPYNYGNTVMAGIGAAMGIVNGILFTPSTGVSGASFCASVILTAISAGRRT